MTKQSAGAIGVLLASLDITLGGMSGYNDYTKQYSNLFEDGFRGISLC